MLNALYFATKGGSAWLNGKKIKVSKVSDPKHAYGAFGWGRDLKFGATMFPKLIPTLGKMRVVGSATICLSRLAQGIYDFSIGTEMLIWDYAAGQIILEEAGGKLILTKKIQIAGNKKLADKLFRKLK